MIGRQVRLESKPKHTERKDGHGKNKQGLGDAGGKGECQKWCCNQQEPSTHNIASDGAGFDRARYRNEEPDHSEQGDARTYEEGDNLCQGAEFHFGAKLVTLTAPYSTVCWGKQNFTIA